MRITSVISIVFVVTLAAAVSSAPGGAQAAEDGRSIFRFDTFGDEQLWTDVLQLHQALQGVPPRTALAVGLKIDADALPREVKSALRNGEVNLDDPAVTVALLQLNSVVGVKAAVNDSGQLTSVGEIGRASCRERV